MLAEDDIFLAEALPILCVTFLRGGWGGGLQRNEHMTFLMDKINM
jgi:hypothetical protein